MFLLVQHRDKNDFEAWNDSCLQSMKELRQQVLNAPSFSLLFEDLNINRHEQIATILLKSFENVPELSELVLLSSGGFVLWGKETLDVTNASSPASFLSKRKTLMRWDNVSPVALGVQTIQLPLPKKGQQKGFVRGVFLRDSSSHVMSVKVSRFTLYSASVSAGAILLLGVFSVATKISRRFAAKQRQVEEYAVSLQQAYDSLRRTKKDLYTSEKLASLGYLAAGIAHEIGNPLGAVLGYVELLRKGRLDPQKTADILRRVEEDVERIQSIIQELLNFSRPHVVHLQTLDVNALIGKTIEQHPPFEAKQIHFRLHLTEFPLWAEVDEHKMRNVLLNLVGNSIDAIEECGDVTISTFRKIRESGTMIGGSEVIAIHIADTGSGIPKELVTKVFDPFFTTKDPGKGMGLGLSWCHRIVESFDGEIEVHSRDGLGTEVAIFLPPAGKRAGDAEDREQGNAGVRKH